MNKENEKLKAKKKAKKEKIRESNRILGIEEEVAENKDLDWDNDVSTDPSIFASTTMVSPQQFNKKDVNFSQKQSEMDFGSPKMSKLEDESPYDLATPKEES